MKFKALTTFFIAVLLISPVVVSGQYQDFRSWWNIDLSKDITSGLKAGLKVSQRFNENSLRYDRSLATLGLEYEALKNLTFEGACRYIILKNRDEFISKYRLHGSASYDIKYNAFTFKFRDQLQYGFDKMNSLNDYYFNTLTNRMRIQTNYNIFASPASLYASYEYYIDFSSVYGILPSAYRVKLGLEWALSTKSDLDLSYTLEKELNIKNPLQSHIISIGFNYNL